MKNIVRNVVILVVLLVGCLRPTGAHAQGYQGHHQSGITGRVAGGVIIATPTGEGSRVVPDIVRVYSDRGELVAEVETEVEGNAWWHFQVNLKPGNYTVTASMPGGYPFSYPVGVTVEKKQFIEVELTFRPI